MRELMLKRLPAGAQHVDALRSRVGACRHQELVLPIPGGPSTNTSCPAPACAAAAATARRSSRSSSSRSTSVSRRAIASMEASVPTIVRVGARKDHRGSGRRGASIRGVVSPGAARQRSSRQRRYTRGSRVGAIVNRSMGTRDRTRRALLVATALLAVSGGVARAGIPTPPASSPPANSTQSGRSA